jgi:hypothetical protein
MFPQQKSEITLNSEIQRVLSQMQALDPDSDEYGTMLTNVTKLHGLKVDETKRKVSRDTWVIVAANLVGIILVLQHERTTVIPKTAMTFVQKLR